MNGAMALLPPKTISKPNKSNAIITGANQNFFRSFMKNHKSFNMSILIDAFCFDSNYIFGEK